MKHYFIVHELSKVRKEIEHENLAKCYLRDILKKKFWDSMNVKGRAIKVKKKSECNFCLSDLRL